jgi:hypothetical protein
MALHYGAQMYRYALSPRRRREPTEQSNRREGAPTQCQTRACFGKGLNVGSQWGRNQLTTIFGSIQAVSDPPRVLNALVRNVYQS